MTAPTTGPTSLLLEDEDPPDPELLCEGEDPEAEVVAELVDGVEVTTVDGSEL